MFIMCEKNDDMQKNLAVCVSQLVAVKSETAFVPQHGGCYLASYV